MSLRDVDDLSAAGGPVAAAAATPTSLDYRRATGQVACATAGGGIIVVRPHQP
jgi:hypothetical protein